MPFDLIIGIIAGGETAIRRPVENAEDDAMQGWQHRGAEQELGPVGPRISEQVVMQTDDFLRNR